MPLGTCRVQFPVALSNNALLTRGIHGHKMRHWPRGKKIRLINGREACHLLLQMWDCHVQRPFPSE